MSKNVSLTPDNQSKFSEITDTYDSDLLIALRDACLNIIPRSMWDTNDSEYKELSETAEENGFDVSEMRNTQIKTAEDFALDCFEAIKNYVENKTTLLDSTTDSTSTGGYSI